jgi:hypothetical protein
MGFYKKFFEKLYRREHEAKGRRLKRKFKIINVKPKKVCGENYSDCHFQSAKIR